MGPQNREAALERGMRTRREKTRYGVEVVIRQIDASIETKKYRGEGLVSTAAGPDFRTAMIHATITGLEKDEPVNEVFKAAGARWRHSGNSDPRSCNNGEPECPAQPTQSRDVQLGLNANL